MGEGPGPNRDVTERNWKSHLSILSRCRLGLMIKSGGVVKTDLRSIVNDIERQASNPVGSGPRCRRSKLGLVGSEIGQDSGQQFSYKRKDSPDGQQGSLRSNADCP